MEEVEEPTFSGTGTLEEEEQQDDVVDDDAGVGGDTGTDAAGGSIRGSHSNNNNNSSSIARTQQQRRWLLPEPLLRAPELSAAASALSRAKELYWDRSHYDSHASQIAALQTSSTVYVGNLAFTTHARHVIHHFSQFFSAVDSGGVILKVHMGLDRYQKKPCGFCFVEFHARKHALLAVSALSGTKLDGSIIRVELDAGFQPGRQYGRGAKGGQVRHDRKPPQQQQQAYQHNSNNKRGREERPTPSNPNNNNTALPLLGATADGESALSSYEPSPPGLPDDGVENPYSVASARDDDNNNDMEEDGSQPAAKRQRKE